MKLIIVFLFIFTMKISSQVAQEWVMRYNGPGNNTDVAKSIAIDTFGNVYVTGSSVGVLTNEYATIKYNSSGTLLWLNRHSFSNTGANPRAITIDSYNNVYVTGSDPINGNGISDFGTIKYNNNGVQQWIQNYNGPANEWDDASSIVVDNIGNVYVTGPSVGIGSIEDYATIKYNSSGVQQWVSRYNGPANIQDYPSSVGIDGFGNVYVTGWDRGNGTAADIATIKYNSAGQQQWVVRYVGPVSTDVATCMVVDNIGNVYITGYSVGINSDDDFITIKYNPDGVQQWLQRYNGPGNSRDISSCIKIDQSGNSYITGKSRGILNDDYCTIKYNTNGIQQWIQRYNGTGNSADEPSYLAIDGNNNIYVTGYSRSSNLSGTEDYATIKYNNSGVQQWIQIYNGPGNNEDYANAIAVSNSGNVYVTGYSRSTSNPESEDYATLKYSLITPPNEAPNLESPSNNSTDQSLTPIMIWSIVTNAVNYNCQISTDINFNSIVFDSSVALTQVIVPSGILNNNTQYFWRVRGANGGGNGPWSVIWNFSTLQSLVTTPVAYEKWISGEKDTIKWSGTNWSFVNIKLTQNFGTPIQSNYTIASGISNGSQSYIWDIPENLLSLRSKITVENSSNPTQNIESNIFRLKPYLLTKINSDSTYYEYRKDRDIWGFSNSENELFSSDWYQQFDYHGTDPFTGMNYSQTQGWFTFLFARSKDFPDWVSWVRTFTTDNCYFDLHRPIYSPLALSRWRSSKDEWKGSCFGIAISNALIFKNKTEFFIKYPNFPQFSNPITIQANDEVRRTVNELFSYQFGQPHTNYRTQYGLKKTVNETLNDLKTMLLNENEPVRTLSFISNNTRIKGGHAILAYKLKKDVNLSNIYYLNVYDNQYPQSDTPIIINTDANDGYGAWSYSNFPNWGGNKYLYLRDPVTTYLSNPIFQEQDMILPDSILQIAKSTNSALYIQDAIGNLTGYNYDSVFINIPNSYPLIFDNAQESSPYGFELNNNTYKVFLKNFTNDSTSICFYNGNKAYIYERANVITSEIDNLSFNYGMEVTSPDTIIKYINLISIIKENTIEKLLSVSSLNINQNDSVQFLTVDSNKHKIISYGSPKSYSILINSYSTSSLGEFEASTINLPENSSHIFVPNWQSLNNSQLIIFVDLGNNGSIDDTLFIDNQIIGTQNEGEIIPIEYALSQNYPNPFNPITTISFDIIKSDDVKLSIYDALGRELVVLINKKLDAGKYKINWDAGEYSSGIYFYRIKAGNFTMTKKMVLLK